MGKGRRGDDFRGHGRRRKRKIKRNRVEKGKKIGGRAKGEEQ